VYLGAAVVDVNIKKSSVEAIYLIMYLNSGPLRLRSAEFLVVDNEMDKFLLGSPLLKTLGFDLDDHLDDNRTALQETVVSTDIFYTLNSTAGKLARSRCIHLMNDSLDT
jgi:hypothetical protein